MEWLRSLGLEGKTSHDKFIPPEYLGSSDATHLELLQGLMEADGTVTDGAAKYTTTSEVLARQVKWLLHTIGVRSTVNYYPNDHAGLWEVRAAVEDNNRLQEICGDQQRFGELASPSPNYIDPAPGLLVELLSGLYRDPRTFQRRPDGTLKQLPKERILDILHGCPLPIADNLPYLAMKNMGWGRILSVELLEGRIPVGDLQVPQTHCFLTNGLVVHNSGAIEFDADVILFLYRDEVYKKETSAAGVAEVNVAKHKNGPTGTVKLAYQKEVHRFEDLADHPEEPPF
jgi:replicative DNA helicase